MHIKSQRSWTLGFANYFAVSAEIKARNMLTHPSYVCTDKNLTNSLFKESYNPLFLRKYHYDPGLAV